MRKKHNGVTTVYVGPHAEWNSSTGWTNYYWFNGKRVAMRNGSGVYWLHGDHLGSASLTTNSVGGTHAQLRYTPYGQERWASGAILTDYRFTDQRSESSVGLLDYDARMYSLALAMFISPDPIVPRPQDSQSLNRYGYARHSPMTRIDPTGHADDDPQRRAFCERFVLACPGLPPAANAAQMGESLSLQQQSLTLNDGTQMKIFTAKSGGDNDNGGNKGKGGGGGGGLIGSLLRLLGGGGAGASKVAQELSKDGDPTNEIGLMAQEAMGGHTIARHVGQTAQQLAQRLANEKGLRAASSYYDFATAESAVAQALSANHSRLQVG